MDDDDVSSLSDGEAEATLVPTAPAPAPASAGTTLSAMRGGKYSSWPRSEALGAALVIDRCGGGDVDIRSVVLDFLENGLVLSHTFEYGEISFKANLPAMVCWSCRRRISGDHDCNLEFFSDNDIPSCDVEEAVLGSCLCDPWPRAHPERSEECKRGYARLVPELVRATGLWREHAAASEANQDPEWPEPDRHLASNSHCDFFDVIGELHPPSLRAMEAAGWYLSHNQWRCETTLTYAAFLKPFGGAAAAQAAARAASANAAAEAVARARDAESAAAAALVTPPRAHGYATAGGAVTGRVLEFFFGDTA
ncbi:unnamed protein product [Pelagomonas calceolata]|uniref:Uncharacterized protein n=2 Tax=Pelagomonas calceolata TaxID=35677 RepID=A0A8J2X4C8_9STRA|nr:unnamed protein product [Pelagomonas calceolata]|mmetsp:Transcript_12056/g.36075  ORF Transcript_12056/g.36075 Transcript_12056/m.36075 type:complete len:309 (+) Transcript_12056:1863-2789(+)